jgi:hypothetical protein
MINSSHVTRCAAIALAGFTALSLAACGSSSAPTSSSAASKPSSANASTSSAAPSSTRQASGGKDRAFGLVGSVSGGTVTLTGPDGSSTVDVTPSTRVTQLTPGQLTDVSAGECAVVRPVGHGDVGGSGSVMAAAVLVGQADNGQCGGQRSGQGHGLAGTVASVTGNSIVLTSADNSQTTVTVTQDTRYSKRSTADTSAITTGLCLAARGSKDGSGNLQATMVNLRPSKDGQCGGGRHQGG